MRRLAMVLSAAALVAGGAVLDVTPAAAAAPTIVTGPGDFASPHVRWFDPSAMPTRDLRAFGGGPASGARVAVGDVDGNGTDETIVASGKGVGSLVVVYGGSSIIEAGFTPYGEFSGGVNVAAGDVDNDGRDEVITAADSGGGPHVRVWDVDNAANITEKVGFFAYDPGFRGGVSVAVANFVGSSHADIVTGAGPGGGPHVRVFDLADGTPSEGAGWFAYAPSFGGGVRVAAGSIGGSTRVVTGAGPGGGPHVRVFAGTGAETAGFFAYGPAFTGGVNVAVGDADADGVGEIVTAPASRGGPHVRTFEASGASGAPDFFAYAPTMTNGVHVAVYGTPGGTSQNSGGSSNSNGGGS